MRARDTESDVQPKHPRIRLRRALAGAALVGLGAAGGGYAMTAASATASTTTTGATGATGSTGSTGSTATCEMPHRMPLAKKGTITAIGTGDVTIGATSYAVDANSDIDKNGESTLSALAVGDAVTFSTTTTNGTVTIDKLHAGSEALDRPAGAPGGLHGLPPRDGSLDRPNTSSTPSSATA